MRDLTFADAVPAAVAGQLDDGSVHLWRMRYAPSQGRAPLLELLGAYLGKPASDVVLMSGAHGKPRVAGPQMQRDGSHPLEFNWSHSGDNALVALSRGRALGVDIERFGRPVRALELARRFFDPAEGDALQSLAISARDRAFIGLWCAKEAVLKAAGEGLSFGLARLVFAPHQGTGWKLVRMDPALGDRDEWQIVGFDAASGYRGALAWRGPASRVFTFQSRPAAG
ncbi:MAG: 4'-phosphopantetheinyl transferase family protein [Rhodanobacteraceae bacterium]